MYAVKPGEIVDWNQGDYQVERKLLERELKCEYESKPTYGRLKKLVSDLKQSIQQELISDVPLEFSSVVELIHHYYLPWRVKTQQTN